MVSIVSAVSTTGCDSVRFGSNPNRHPIIKFFKRKGYIMGNWKKARIKDNLVFKKYTPSNLEKIKFLTNKIIKIKKISKFFYEIKNENTLIFFGDIILDDEDDPYRSDLKWVCGSVG